VLETVKMIEKIYKLEKISWSFLFTIKPNVLKDAWQNS